MTGGRVDSLRSLAGGGHQQLHLGDRALTRVEARAAQEPPHVLGRLLWSVDVPDQAVAGCALLEAGLPLVRSERTAEQLQRFPGDGGGLVVRADQPPAD